MGILRSPSLKCVYIQCVRGIDHGYVHVNRGHWTVSDQPLRHKSFVVLQTVHKCGGTGNHPLIDQLLGKMFLGNKSAVIEEHRPKTSVQKVPCCVFASTDVQIHLTPVFHHFIIGQRSCILRIHVAQKVEGTSRPTWHSVQFKGENCLLVDQFIGNHAILDGIPGPMGSIAQGRLSGRGGQILFYLRQNHRQMRLIYQLGHPISVKHRKWFPPISLSTKNGIPQTVIDFTLTQTTRFYRCYSRL